MLDYVKKLADAYEASWERDAERKKLEEKLAAEAAAADADYVRLKVLGRKCLATIQAQLDEHCPDMLTELDAEIDYTQNLSIWVDHSTEELECAPLTMLALESAHDSFEVWILRSNPGNVAFCLCGPDNQLRLGSMASLKELLEKPSLIDTRVGELCSLIAQEMVEVAHD